MESKRKKQRNEKVLKELKMPKDKSDSKDNVDENQSVIRKENLSPRNGEIDKSENISEGTIKDIYKVAGFLNKEKTKSVIRALSNKRIRRPLVHINDENSNETQSSREASPVAKKPVCPNSPSSDTYSPVTYSPLDPWRDFSGSWDDLQPRLESPPDSMREVLKLDSVEQSILADLNPELLERLTGIISPPKPEEEVPMVEDEILTSGLKPGSENVMFTKYNYPARTSPITRGTRGRGGWIYSGSNARRGGAILRRLVSVVRPSPASEEVTVTPVRTKRPVGRPRKSDPSIPTQVLEDVLPRLSVGSINDLAENSSYYSARSKLYSSSSTTSWKSSRADNLNGMDSPDLVSWYHGCLERSGKGEHSSIAEERTEYQKPRSSLVLRRPQDDPETRRRWRRVVFESPGVGSSAARDLRGLATQDPEEFAGSLNATLMTSEDQMCQSIANLAILGDGESFLEYSLDQMQSMSSTPIPGALKDLSSFFNDSDNRQN